MLRSNRPVSSFALLARTTVLDFRQQAANHVFSQFAEMSASCRRAVSWLTQGGEHSVVDDLYETHHIRDSLDCVAVASRRLLIAQPAFLYDCQLRSQKTAIWHSISVDGAESLQPKKGPETLAGSHNKYEAPGT